MPFFPTSVATTAELRGNLVDNLSTALSANLTDSATTINVDDTTSFPTTGLLSLKKAAGSGLVEVVSYTGKTATSFTGVTRNINGAGASAYSTDDEVHHYFTATHWNTMIAELIAVEQNISDRFGLDDGTGDITMTGAGKGLVVTTPNGSNTYRIAISNDGELTTQLVT